MLGSGAIHPSQSVWCNAVVLVQKKEGGLHFCVNFCHLNAHMKKDSYPLLRIEKTLESLVGAGHFSCLDLKSGFCQIKMEESSKQYTAFTLGNLGFFECDCMLFGLCSAPATFQWLMQKFLRELNLIYCLIYLDDIVAFLQQLQNACHLELTLRCMPFLVCWATTEGLSRGLHALHSHVMNTGLRNGPAGSQSGCHFQKMPWRLSKC